MYILIPIFGNYPERLKTYIFFRRHPMTAHIWNKKNNSRNMEQLDIRTSTSVQYHQRLLLLLFGE